MKSIFIAIPTGDEKIYMKCMNSLINLIIKLNHNNIKCTYAFFTCSHINSSRNQLVSSFLESNFTHLLFIDTDVYDYENTILEMLNQNVGVIGCPYPIKELDKNNLTPNLEDCTQFNINLKNKRIEIEDDIIETENLGTGCLLVKREIFEKLMDKFPERRYKNLKNQNLNEKYLYNFFDSFIHPTKRFYLTEDYGFCYLIKLIKEKVYAYTKKQICHIGTFNYKGSFYNYYKNKLSIE